MNTDGNTGTDAVVLGVLARGTESEPLLNIGFIDLWTLHHENKMGSNADSPSSQNDAGPIKISTCEVPNNMEHEVSTEVSRHVRLKPDSLCLHEFVDV